MRTETDRDERPESHVHLTLSPGRLLGEGGQTLLVLASQRGPSWTLQPAWRRIAEAVGPGAGAFLEVGCGAGWLALYVASGRAELDAVGIDDDPVAISVGERNKGGRLNVTLRVMDPGHIVYPDRTFHAAASVRAAGRWADPGAVFAEVHRVLRPGASYHVYEGDPRLRDWPEGWLRSPGPWLPKAAILAWFRRGTLADEAWEVLKRAARESPFGGGVEGTHGPFRVLTLTRKAV